MSTNYLKQANSSKNVVFIVEDDEVYAKTLQGFLETRFSNKIEIFIFRIGELCLLELDRNPKIILMDYFLNSKYEEAQNGLEIIKRIKTQKPLTNIIVLSAQDKFKVAIELIKQYACEYIQKDQEDAFNKIEQLIKEIINHDNPSTFEKRASVI